MASRFAIAVAASAAVLVGACVTTPDPGDLLSAPIRFKTIPGAPAVRDGRADFRETFCANLRAEGLVSRADRSCRRWLWRLPGEPGRGAVRRDQIAAPAQLAVFLVTGAFSECVGEAARPFPAGAARLRAEGAYVATIVAGGRSGTGINARRIAESIEHAPLRDDQTVIIIGYSKGALDALRFLVDFPELAGKVDAVVSVASPIFGSTIADLVEPAYSALFAGLPYDKCPPGDRQVISSLSPDTATHWLASNALPARVRYYSLAGFTSREHVARALVTPWTFLNRVDTRNDGQVVAADAVIPGSTLLGYANADHWGIAQSTELARDLLVARPDPDPFPIDQLFRSIVQFVAADLAEQR